MKIVLVSATTFEIAPAIQHLENHWNRISFTEYKTNKIHLFPLVSGIGSTMMAFALARFKPVQDAQLVIHAGISGSYNLDLQITEVVEVISEQWADLGAEDKDGNFIDGFELGLMQRNAAPYNDGKLIKQHHTISTGLKQVSGLTVNKTSGTKTSIEQIRRKFHADVESMEGAGLFYACRTMDIPFISIRAISNYVEPRDKSNWKLEESINVLNSKLIEIIDLLTIQS